MRPTEETDPDDTVVEVEFEVTDPQYPLVALSEETDCKAELVQLLPRSDGAYTVFHQITGGEPDQILDLMRDYGGIDTRVVSDTDESAIVEFRISQDEQFFVISLTDKGAIPRELRSEDGVARIIAEIPSIYSASEVIDQFQKSYPSMQIIARRQKEYPVPFFHQQALQDTVFHLLTPRQHESLLLAYMNGFFDWPREKTGEEIAEELGVTPATFHQHLRTAEQKVFSVLFRQ